jgi:antitoxin component HigA of HigAB toxin-antitoxin module
MKAVFDEKKGPLAEYAETLAILIEHYEEELYPIKEASALEILKFLMQQNNRIRGQIFEFDNFSICSKIR